MRTLWLQKAQVESSRSWDQGLYKSTREHWGQTDERAGAGVLLPGQSTGSSRPETEELDIISQWPEWGSCKQERGEKAGRPSSALLSFTSSVDP